MALCIALGGLHAKFGPTSLLRCPEPVHSHQVRCSRGKLLSIGLPLKQRHQKKTKLGGSHGKHRNATFCCFEESSSSRSESPVDYIDVSAISVSSSEEEVDSGVAPLPPTKRRGRRKADASKEEVDKEYTDIGIAPLPPVKRRGRKQTGAAELSEAKPRSRVRATKPGPKASAPKSEREQEEEKGPKSERKQEERGAREKELQEEPGSPPAADPDKLRDDDAWKEEVKGRLMAQGRKSLGGDTTSQEALSLEANVDRLMLLSHLFKDKMLARGARGTDSGSAGDGDDEDDGGNSDEGEEDEEEDQEGTMLFPDEGGFDDDDDDDEEGGVGEVPEGGDVNEFSWGFRLSEFFNNPRIMQPAPDDGREELGPTSLDEVKRDFNLWREFEAEETFKMRELTLPEWPEFAMGTDGPVMVCLFARYGAEREKSQMQLAAMTAAVERIWETSLNLKAASVDVSTEGELGALLGVDEAPAVLFIRGGRLIFHLNEMATIDELMLLAGHYLFGATTNAVVRKFANKQGGQ